MHRVDMRLNVETLLDTIPVSFKSFKSDKKNLKDELVKQLF